MSLTISNRSHLPDREVEQVVRFAFGEIEDAENTHVVVQTEQSGRYRRHQRGWACRAFRLSSTERRKYLPSPTFAGYLCVLWIGAEARFPYRNIHRKRAGSVIFANWQEMLAHLAAHEAKHVEHWKTERRYRDREVRCELFANRVLRLWRELLAEQRDHSREAELETVPA